MNVYIVTKIHENKLQFLFFNIFYKFYKVYKNKEKNKEKNGATVITPYLVII